MKKGFRFEWELLVKSIGYDSAVKVLGAFEGMRVYFPRSALIEIQRNKIIDLYKQGKTKQEIANELHCTIGRVRSIIDTDRL